MKSDRIAIVTGNSRGIGKAISDELKKEGVFVPEISRTSGYDLMKEGIEKLLKDYPNCDILINNVGGMGRCKEDEWEDCWKKNYGIMAKIIMHYVPRMKEGRVITISSIY